MTYRDSTDPPRTAHPSLLFFGALVVAATIVAIISLIYALNRTKDRHRSQPHAVSASKRVKKAARW
jgi:hypothetical protein